MQGNREEGGRNRRSGTRGTQSPRLARKILAISLGHADRDDVIGDLEEKFASLRDEIGPKPAAAWYWSQVVRSAPRFVILSSIWLLPMLKNYLVLGLRTFARQKTTSAINVLSLAIGIAFCSLIFLFVRDELTFDAFHDRSDRIFRITFIKHTPDGGVEWENAVTPMPLGEAIENEIPGAEAAVRLLEGNYHVRLDGELIEQKFLYADPSIFDVFSFPVVSGDPSTALSDPSSVVLTETSAERYFGLSDPVGETLQVRFDNGSVVDLTVSAVAKDPPANSTVHFEVLLPLERFVLSNTWVHDNLENWHFGFLKTYVVLRENESQRDAQALLADLKTKYLPDEEPDDESESARGHREYSYRLQPLKDVHLEPAVTGGLTPASNPRYITILSAIAAVILLLGCINFMTLAIGRSAGRVREIGLRKVVGAQRGQLMYQFWSEAFLLSIAGLALGIVLGRMALPIFGELTGKALQFDFSGSTSVWLALGGIFVVTGLLAGSYPAVFLSAFRPIESLGTKLRLRASNRTIRVLVAAQFGLSIALVISAATMDRQLDYARSTNIGFNGSHLITIRTGDFDPDRALAVFKDEVASRGEFQSVSATSFAFPRGGIMLTIDYAGKEYNDVALFRVDPNYARTLDLELESGRDFNPESGTDVKSAILVNESFARRLDLTRPVGTKIEVPAFTGERQLATIVGVVRDFKFQSLHKDVSPTVITLNPDFRYWALVVRVAPGAGPGAYGDLRQIWKRLAPETPFVATYMEDDLQQLYEDDLHWSLIIRYASILAILVACLGLFGIASMMAAARRREVGIRKVLGAGVAEIGLQLTRGFAGLVVLGMLLATPLAYVVMTRWLNTFAYHVDLSPWTFVLAGTGALVLACATIALHVVRTASVNPAECLRNE